MTNDTNTLNGALQELGELMASNLTEQGVTASASDGLTTLAEKILDITNVRNGSVTLTSSSASITAGNNVQLSATVLNACSNPMPNETVTFYNGNTVIATGTTDSNGVATYNYWINNSGTYSLTAKSGNITSQSVTVTVTKIPTSVTLSSSSATVTLGNTLTLSGEITGINNILSWRANLYEDNTLIDTVARTGAGIFHKTLTPNTVGTHTYYVHYTGDATYEACTSNTVTVTVSGQTGVYFEYDREYETIYAYNIDEYTYCAERQDGEGVSDFFDAENTISMGAYDITLPTNIYKILDLETFYGMLESGYILTDMVEVGAVEYFTTVQPL